MIGTPCGLRCNVGSIASKTARRRLFTYLSCSQATLSSVVDSAGIGDRGAVKAALPLEGGGLNHGSTCGVVSGGCLSIALANEAGLASGDERMRTEVYGQLKEYTEWFEGRFGSTLCRDRIGTGLTTPGGIAHYLFSGRVLTRCVSHAGPAAERLSERLAEQGKRKIVDGPDRPGYCAAPVMRRIRLETGAGEDFLETISVALDGGVGLSGGLCGALAGALMAAGTVWGTDPATTGTRGAAGSLVRAEYNTFTHSETIGLWSCDSLVEGFEREFGSLECRDIARPLESAEDLDSFMESSSTCARVTDWCAAEASALISRSLPV